MALLAYNGLRLHRLRHDAVYNEEVRVEKAWGCPCLGHHTAVLHHHSRLGRSQACRLGRTYEVRHVWEVCQHHFSEDISWRCPCHVHILSSMDNIVRS